MKKDGVKFVFQGGPKSWKKGNFRPTPKGGKGGEDKLFLNNQKKKEKKPRSPLPPRGRKARQERVRKKEYLLGQGRGRAVTAFMLAGEESRKKRKKEEVNLQQTHERKKESGTECVGPCSSPIAKEEKKREE